MTGRRLIGAILVSVAACSSDSTTAIPDSGSDPGSSSPTGTGSNATHVVFIAQPRATTIADTINRLAIGGNNYVRLAVEDASGNLVPTAPAVTLSLGSNSVGARLSGTLTEPLQAEGYATFYDLTIDKPALGLTLVATSPGSTNAVSNPFTVRGFTAVSAGFQFACGITTDGLAFCWGRNDAGQLGNGSTTSSNTPIAVSGGQTFSAISAGNAFSCGVTTQHTAYCWGDNSYGELGNGSTVSSSVPVPVSGGISFSTISAGGEGSSADFVAQSACAVTTAGVPYCWGANFYGQLGNGSLTNSNIPVAVSGGLAFTSVAVGNGFACGLATSATAYCWGANSSGQLGNGTTTSTKVPTAITGTSFLSVNTNSGSFACGLGTDHSGYCWGYNQYGFPGPGISGVVSSPRLVTNSQSGAEAAIAAGYGYGCEVATSNQPAGATSGPVYCWGLDNFGQLGYLNPTGCNLNSLATCGLVAASGGVLFQALTAGFGISCGITPGSAAYCWGDDTYGELGNGSNPATTFGAGIAGISITPVRVFVR